MKTILSIFLICFIGSALGQAHSIYFSPQVGPYLNTSVKQPMEMMGYSVEVGYCYKGMINAGVDFGSLDFSHKYPFTEARTGFTFLERSAFSATLCAGLGYCFNRNELISEGDLNANIHLPKSYDFVLSFGNQYVVGIGYLPSFNLGFCKTFIINTKTKKHAH